MGYIDKTTHTAYCTACDITESQAILDKGSNYGGSYWQGPAKFAQFETTWNAGSDKQEPELLTASCKRCGAEAKRSQRGGI